MQERTGGQALVQALIGEGVDTVFALPGVQLDWAFDALYEERARVRVIHTRHEQATSYMADGYARSTGKVGVCLVVPGPGLLNAMAGLSTAYACNAPVLCISGQIQSDLIGRGRGLLHEIPHQLEMMAAVTQWAARATAPGEIPGLVREAFQRMRAGRPRPVALEIPPDVLQARAPISPLEPAAHDPVAPDPAALKQAAVALGRAERPLIFVGSGIISAEASAASAALAEALQAPVVMSANGRGALSDRHPLALPPLAGRLLLPRADAVLAVGTRFVQPAVEWGIPTDATVVQIDIDPAEVGRNTPPTIGLVADARSALTALQAELPTRSRPSRATEVAAVREHIADLLFEVQPQAGYAAAIRAVLPEDGIFVGDMTQVGYFARQGFPVYAPRTYLSPGYQGTLGCGFPIALGAQVGNPGRKVVSVNGDGGFMFNVQELATMRQHDIGVVAIVFNDGAFGNVKRIQEQQFGGRTIASELRNPDFVRLAEVFGIPGMRATTPEMLVGVLREALATAGPVLIDVPVGPMPGTWHLQSVPITRDWW